MADYDYLWNQFVGGIDPNDPDQQDQDQGQNQVVPVPNIAPAIAPKGTHSVTDPRLPDPIALPSPPRFRDPYASKEEGGLGMVLPPPTPPSEEGNREFQASIPHPQPGDPSLTDAAWAERPISGIRNRIKRGFETMALTGLGGQSSPRAAMGQMAGSLLTGIIYPKAANAAYQERIAHPRQQREIAEADAKREREYRAQMEQQETQIRAGQIEAQGRAAAAAKWIVISPAGGTVGANGKRYQVLHDTSSPNNDNDQWLELPPAPPIKVGTDLVVPDPQHPDRYIKVYGGDGKAAKAPVLYSAQEAAKGAATELGADFNKEQTIKDTLAGRQEQIRQRVNSLEADAQFKDDKGQPVDAFTHYKALISSNPTKAAKEKAQEKIAQATKDVMAGATKDVESAYNQRLAALTPRYKAWQKDMPIPDFGLEHYNEPVPPEFQGIPRAATPAPTGAQPQAGAAAPPANYTPRQNTSGKITQAGMEARLAELSQQLGLDPKADKTKLTAILRQEGWLP